MATLKKSSKKKTPSARAKKAAKSAAAGKKAARKTKSTSPKRKSTRKPPKKAAKKTLRKKAAPKKSPRKKAAPKKKNVPAQKRTAARKTTKNRKATPKKKAVSRAAAKKSASGKKKTTKKASKRPVRSRKSRKTSSGNEPALPMAKKKVAPRLPVGKTGRVVKPGKKPYTAAFLRKQKKLLLSLRDQLLDTMHGVARDSLRHAEGGETSAFGTHQADAGSDSYDRDLSLNLLSQEQDALHEIDEALARLDQGVYGICESCGRAIPRARLQFLPWARLTVECQEELEKSTRGNATAPTGSLFRRGVKDGAGSGV